jgi:hypothetical protein
VSASATSQWPLLGGNGEVASDVLDGIGANLELKAAAEERGERLAGAAEQVAEQVRAKFGHAGANAVGVGGQVEGAERTDLAVPDQAGGGIDLDGAVEDVDGLAAGPGVSGR